MGVRQNAVFFPSIAYDLSPTLWMGKLGFIKNCKLLYTP